MREIEGVKDGSMIVAVSNKVMPLTGMDNCIKYGF